MPASPLQPPEEGRVIQIDVAQCTAQQLQSITRQCIGVGGVDAELFCYPLVTFT